LAAALQSFGRHWIPVLQLRRLKDLAMHEKALSVLVYAASTPLADRRRGSYGYESMSPLSVRLCAASAIRRLPALLAPIHAQLLAAGNVRLAEEYDPARTNLIIAAVQRKPRTLAGLLFFDAFLLDQAIHLASLAREIVRVRRKNPTRALRGIRVRAERFAMKFEGAMKRLPPEVPLRDLAPLFILEATRLAAGGTTEKGFEIQLEPWPDEDRQPAAIAA